MNTHPLMLANGYEISGESQSLRAGTGGGSIQDDIADRLEGRLSNVRYMAHAMDIFDTGQSHEPYDHSGSRQFDHLMSKPGLQWTGYLYVAIRRAQRERRLLDVQRGLALLLAMEQGIIEGRAAVSAAAPELTLMEDMRADEGEKPLLDRQAEVLAIESRVR